MEGRKALKGLFEGGPGGYLGRVRWVVGEWGGGDGRAAAGATDAVAGGVEGLEGALGEGGHGADEGADGLL